METELAPGFLVAAPTLADPRFAHTVILLAEHGEDGSLGFVVNRKTPLTVGEVAREVGVDTMPAYETNAVHYGGPVSPERGWVLFRGLNGAADDAEDEEILDVGDNLFLGATVDLFGKLLAGARPCPFRFLLGYAGWGEGQLEEEIQSGSWLLLDFDPDLVFDDAPDDVWEKAIRRLGLSPGAFFMTGGGNA